LSGFTTAVSPHVQKSPDGNLSALTLTVENAALVAALRTGDPDAASALFDRLARKVRAVLLSTIGPDDDIPDLVHEVFIRALARIHTLRDADKLPNWVLAIAALVGRAHVNQRHRRSKLQAFSPERTRLCHLEQPPSDARRALRDTCSILDELAFEARMAFVLRYVHGMTVADAAAACATSRSTFKRRLSRATADFLRVARTRPSLVQCLQEGTRWTEMCEA